VSNKLPTTSPAPSPETAPFWEATKRDVLLVPRCDACGATFWYPRFFCPFCHAKNISWLEASGKGTIYSFTVSMRGWGDWAEVTPYVVAYVELDEGPRMLTNIVECDPDELEVGQRVAVVFDQAGEYKYPRFRPEV
jgi:uncharacterized protein